MSENSKPCPQFSYWGASYPDACCINGKLYDLDRCNDNDNLYEPIDDIPCPFCRTEEFIECDPFGKEEEFYEGIENEEKAREKTRDWYLQWIDGMKKRYG